MVCKKFQTKNKKKKTCSPSPDRRINQGKIQSYIYGVYNIYTYIFAWSMLGKVHETGKKEILYSSVCSALLQLNLIDFNEMRVKIHNFYINWNTAAGAAATKTIIIIKEIINEMQPLIASRAANQKPHRIE